MMKLRQPLWRAIKTDIFGKNCKIRLIIPKKVRFIQKYFSEKTFLSIIKITFTWRIEKSCKADSNLRVVADDYEGGSLNNAKETEKVVIFYDDSYVVLSGFNYAG